MILKDKVRLWAREGVQEYTGGEEGKGEETEAYESEEMIQLTKETFENGRFLEAVMFKLYYGGWINAEDWEGTEAEVEKMLEEELQLIVE